MERIGQKDAVSHASIGSIDSFNFFRVSPRVEIQERRNARLVGPMRTQRIPDGANTTSSTFSNDLEEDEEVCWEVKESVESLQREKEIHEKDAKDTKDTKDTKATRRRGGKQQGEQTRRGGKQQGEQT
jgi:hypothetical protein